MKLLIISHTEHYYNLNQELVGLGPTVREINHLSREFDKVIHIGVLYKKGSPPEGFIPYEHSSIRFRGIPSYGGKGIMDKLRVLFFIPMIITILLKELSEAEIYQFRAPTSIGVFIIPFLTLFTNKKGWYKYAGNWAQKKPPLSYAFQRWWLARMQKRKVTINGSWSNLPKHCLSFENPCLEEEDLKKGEIIRHKKSYDIPLTLCFVGRIESAKGVARILEVIKNHPHKEWFKVLHMVGNGDELENFKQKSKEVSFPIVFHGSLNRYKVFEIYRKSHLIILPSTASEGFPKVIAEAANFGCIPVTSDISSISQYITKDRGYLWQTEKENFMQFFNKIDFPNENLENKAKEMNLIAKSFTYDHYIDRIKKEIL
jgi:glycosyltransferase involved in cell wall biosynthesis